MSRQAKDTASLKISRNLQAELKTFAASRGLKMQDVAEEAIRGKINGAAKPGGLLEGLTQHQRELVDKWVRYIKHERKRHPLVELLEDWDELNPA